jgi:GDSL-like Lipase/Acylhydrolase family
MKMTGATMFKHPTSRRTVLGGALATAAAITLQARSAKANSGKHIVLLGDSIFDNGAYVGNGLDVVQQLRMRLAGGARATLEAVDGSITSAVRSQLERVPADATHLVVSAGGNDALRCANVLEEKAGSVGEALEKLASVRDRFVADYKAMLDGVIARGLPAACCTIYDPRFPDKTQRRLASVGLTIFNECITREASARGLALIDLRLICCGEEDLANAIEPSAIGGAKIANAIADFAAEYDRSKGRSEVFAEASGGI